ncbi:MAG: hypothetical protein ABIE75_05440 [Candidatus Omnitrophota bacterium]
MLKKILTALLLFILLFFIFKDYLLTSGINYLLNKKFSQEAGITKAGLLLNGITLEDFHLSRGNLKLKLGKMRITFNFFKPSIDDLSISDCDLQFKDKTIDLAIEKSQDNLYIIDTDFLGSSAEISGVLDYQGYNRICLEINFQDSSFEKLIQLFDEKDSLLFEGFFNGKLKLCLDKGKISNLGGDFYNNSGGTIQIKKEASLGFLEPYFDKAAYDALIDNFKYYVYNRGKIRISQRGELIALNLDFSSQELGRRNILVNLHNILGAKQ